MDRLVLTDLLTDHRLAGHLPSAILAERISVPYLTITPGTQ